MISFPFYVAGLENPYTIASLLSCIVLALVSEI